MGERGLLRPVIASRAARKQLGRQLVDADGASDFLVQVLGERGKHARSAVGTAALPLGAAVEVEAIFEVE